MMLRRFLTERARLLRERSMLWVAWRLPRRLVYWCAIRVVASATTGGYDSEDATTVTAMDAIKRWQVS